MGSQGEEEEEETVDQKKGRQNRNSDTRRERSHRFIPVRGVGGRGHEKCERWCEVLQEGQKGIGIRPIFPG